MCQNLSNFLQFAPNWRIFGTLMGPLCKIWRKFLRKIVIFGSWMGQ